MDRSQARKSVGVEDLPSMKPGWCVGERSSQQTIKFSRGHGVLCGFRALSFRHGWRSNLI